MCSSSRIGWSTSAPEFQRTPDALSLLELAAAGRVSIHVPHVALREAQSVIVRKRRPPQLDVLRQFRKWAVQRGRLSTADAEVIRRFLDDLTNTVTGELAHLDERIEEVAHAEGVHVFALDDRMLARSISLRTEVAEPQLRPFDEVILAAVLERAATLPVEHARVFCTMDFDLAPIVKGNERPQLKAVYAAAGIELRTSFNLHGLLP